MNLDRVPREGVIDDGKTRYKLIRCIGRGGSSLIYEAKAINSEDEEYESFGADITDGSHGGAEDYTQDISGKDPGEIFIPWNNYPGIYDEGEENTA